MRSNLTISAIAGAICILGAGSSPSASGAPADDACSLLTQAQVSAVLGISVEPGQRVIPNSPKMCGWAGPGGPTIDGKKVTLTISTPEKFDRGKTPFQGITKTPVSGIGDDAYYVTAGGFGTTLNVKKGSASFSISVGGFPIDQVKAKEKILAQDALAKL
jgi:hypothetical protein